jgi:hypothetical protein
MRIPAHFRYNEFKKKCACRRTLDTMNSKKMRLPAHFGYNDFKKKNAPAGALWIQ